MRSVFTSRNTDTVPIVDGHTATIRQLAPRQLDEARQVSQRRSMAQFADLDVDVFRKVQAVSASEIATAKTADPLIGFDAETLVRLGVLAWTLDAPVDEATVADLDEDVRDTIARAVLRLSKPSLFRTVDEQEADRKNA